MASRELNIDIDNRLFKLYFAHTMSLLIFFSGLIFVHVVVGWARGSSIVCGSLAPVEEHIINNCWRDGLFRPPTSEREPKFQNATIDFDGLTQLPTFYHLTAVLLLLHAAMFCLPFFVWLHLEGGTLDKLLNKMNECTDEDDPTIMDTAKLFFTKHKHGQHNSYYWKFIFCEFLNYIVGIVQMIAINYFFDIDFFTYGIRYATGGYRNKFNSLDFPLYSYCKMPEDGNGSSQDRIVENFGVCIISINEINATVCFILWIWFIILGTVSIDKVASRVSLALGPSSLKISHFVANINTRDRFEAQLLYRSRIPEDWRYFEQYCTVGDLFVLEQILKNMYNDTIFQEFLDQVNACLKEEYERIEELRVQRGIEQLELVPSHAA